MERRHNDPQTPHERARFLASDRLDGPLSPSDAAWLDDHLRDCEPCRTTTTAYAQNRALLRSLAMPDPPRDLWARTSVAIARERARSVPSAARPRIRLRREGLAGLLAIAVVAVVVARSLAPAGGAPGVGQATTAPGESRGPGPSAIAGATPLAVPPGNVAWAMPGENGSYTVNVANVDAVCPESAAPAADCAPLNAGATQIVSLTSKPGSIVLAPKAGQAAVVDSTATTTGGSIMVVPIARPTPTSPPPTSPPPAATASASNSPSVPPEATAVATPTPPESPTPSPTTESSPSSPPPPATPTPSPTSEPSPSPSATVGPTSTPAPTLATTLAIIDHVIVVGGDAAYSADGEWLAFSARPADGSQGPDVYVWHLGDDVARALTTDHGTVFSDWVDGRVLVSRFVDTSPSDPDAASSTTGPGEPVSLLLDPATGEQLGSTLPGIWRPVVDPSGQWVVYWTGTLVYDEAARMVVPDQGRLVVDDWTAVLADAPNATPDPRPLLDTKSDTPIREWEVRWDPTGRYVGVWVADPLTAGLGRLSLIAIDPATGRIDEARRQLLRNGSALAGFAIGDGRIAWATPPGQDGDGSRLLVLAWKGPDAGRIQSDPAASRGDIVVVR
jgi:Putative zinc-finger